MDLSGSWRAVAAHEELRRTFHEPQLDDRAWCDVNVPGHWSDADGLEDHRNVLHRVGFSTSAPADDRRVWLEFAGICQQGDVWLDGAYVGDTEGYFVPHSFEITKLVRARNEHLLAVDVSTPKFGDPDSRSDLLGAYIDPELSGTADANPGGIWRPVTIRETGTAAIRHFRAVCADANENRARVTVRCVFDTPDSGPVTLRTEVAGHDHELNHPAAAGENRVEWTFEVPQPELWWPHSLGGQPLHSLTCSLVIDEQTHDSRTRDIGFRSVRIDNWTMSVNDTRIFVKGVSALPTTPRPGDTTVQQIASDLTAVRDAGLDLVRCHTHLARPEFYELADQLGLLVWQDLPLRGLMARGVRKQAVRQAREAVDLLGHHPSVAVWCGHDEPHRRPEQPLTTPPVLSQQIPSWNRAVLDSSVKRVIERTDGSRPIVAHTGVPPHLPQLDGTTSSLWFGWNGGKVSDIGAWMARLPRMARFVSAFGSATVSPSLPELDDILWPHIDWEALGRLIGADASSLQHVVAPRHIGKGTDWAQLTVAAQADIVRTTIEHLRRVKYRPTGGFIHHYLADATPSGGFGVLDSSRSQKPAWNALVDACRPVIVVADSLPVMSHSGDRHRLSIHVISDRHEPLEDAVVTASAIIGEVTVDTMRWGGTMPADECSSVGTFVVAVPDEPVDESKELKVVLRIESGQIDVSNHYISQLI